MQAQPRPLTHNELDVAPVFVMHRLHVILCKEETVPYLLQELVAVLELTATRADPGE